jgi:hypothetical protein
MAQKDNKPPEKDHKVIESNPFEQRRVKGPVVWAVLLFVPVMLGVLVAMRQPSPQAMETQQNVSAEVVQSQAPQENPEERLRRLQADERIRAAGKEVPACNTDGWTGLKMEGVTLERAKALGVPYRVLPPGSMTTQDYSPDRLNFDLDSNGAVTRAWCG